MDLSPTINPLGPYSLATRDGLSPQKLLQLIVFTQTFVSTSDAIVNSRHLSRQSLPASLAHGPNLERISLLSLLCCFEP